MTTFIVWCLIIGGGFFAFRAALRNHQHKRWLRNEYNSAVNERLLLDNEMMRTMRA